MNLFPTLRKSLYLRQPWVIWNFLASGLINLILWTFINYKIEPTITPLPIHFTIYFGIDLTAPFWYYYLFPLIGLIIIIAHGIIGKFFYRDELYLSIILLSSSTIINALLLGITIFLSSFI